MSKPHPFQISVSENPMMKAFDLMLLIGGFQTKSEAEDFAKLLGEFVKESGKKGWIARIQ